MSKGAASAKSAVAVSTVPVDSFVAENAAFDTIVSLIGNLDYLSNGLNTQGDSPDCHTNWSYSSIEYRQIYRLTIKSSRRSKHLDSVNSMQNNNWDT